MNSDVEAHIRKNHLWVKLPANIKQVLGNSQKEYEKAILQFSIKNQLRYKLNIVKSVLTDERKYYENVMQYSQEHLMLYPYHLSDVVVKGLRVTPFIYYTNMMAEIMTQEKSYDSLPNFTAADCLRLLGIGRNQYIELMNQCRSSKKFFRKKSPRDLLPTQPVETLQIEPWWLVNTGYITEDDIKICSAMEKAVIDTVIDCGPQTARDMDFKIIHRLYRKGLVYLDVPINDEDCIIVPPLEGFVMNRVLGDYFETLLYKIFVSIDEHTTVAELSSLLQIDLQLVKNAVSMYCRLGFAKKKGVEVTDEELHPSWRTVKPVSKKPSQDQLLLGWRDDLLDVGSISSQSVDLTSLSTPSSTDLDILGTPDAAIDTEIGQSGASKRIAFLFDSTLTAFLMMGNLSPGLKSHAVTMFEVGKLSDESLDSFISELEKVGSEAEGEAKRYFIHALTLRDTICFLRNKNLSPDSESGSRCPLDLIRCESLLSLEPAARARVLNKNYSLMVSMAPLSYEIRPVSSCTPQHLGPAIPEVNSVWFKFYIYCLTGCGPPSLLLVKGNRLRRLPSVFLEYDRLLVTTWGHDPAVIATSNVLLTLNDALTHSAVLVQVHGWQSKGKVVHVPFPLDVKNENAYLKQPYHKHSAIQNLASKVDLEHTCGFITILNTGRESRTIWKREEEEHDLLLGTNDAHIFSSENKADPDLDVASFHFPESEHSTDSSNELDEPKNGITDDASAKILASEIDFLQQESRHMSLDLGNQSNKRFVEQEWTLLDCYFGLPLFHTSLNKEVCERIKEKGLGRPENLQELLQSSRKLSLGLLSFISKCRDTVRANADGFPSESLDHKVPFPTANLLFCNGVLEQLF
ncbi:hypothetical protein CHS0354_016001 [Potamilus streckersoni]|uniref:Protein FAM91A1 n=1 Tax=Potamilus streckersoni TaxID=2493646 RepID=A0AAE0SZA4_9BIVA|nr:hypothetical protein CHS0354_016001 [Potamilus streckersoni]